MIKNVANSFVLALLLVIALGCGGGSKQPLQPAGEPRGSETAWDQHDRYALLVGCTNYQLENLADLQGCENDVKLFSEMLRDQFNFEETQIHTLAGWPDDKWKRPTYRNIVARLAELADKANDETDIVVLLSGHGCQSPIPESQNAFDENNPEPDCMDEVFLPSDVGKWDGETKGITNGLYDNEIRDWVDKVTAKGASVWIIFDCCHSGTMVRGDDEVARRVLPEDLGIPSELIVNAQRNAEENIQRSDSFIVEGSLELGTRRTQKGKVVATYAAQSFEAAYEMPLPTLESDVHGLLTFMLVSAISESSKNISYRQLSQMLVARYRAKRRSRGPTCFSEGALDTQILENDQSKKISEIILEKADGKLRVNGGALIGLTAGSILAVYPHASDSNDPKRQPLGHVKVTKLSANTAIVEPCQYGDSNRAPVAIESLPDLADCDIVSRKFEDIRLKLAFSKPTIEEAHEDDLDELIKVCSEAINRLAEDDKMSLIRVVEKDVQADWVLRIVTPDEARESWNSVLDETRLCLVQGQNLATLRDDSTDRHRGVQPLASKLFATYEIDSDSLASELKEDVKKIYQWEGLWHAAGTLSGETSDLGLTFSVERLDDQKKAVGVMRSGSAVRPGQRVRISIHNTGEANLWVNLLYLSGDFSIHQLTAIQLEAESKPVTKGFRITGATTGVEGLILIAAPIESHPQRPYYDFLQQAPLGNETRDIGFRKRHKTVFTDFLESITAESELRQVRPVQECRPNDPHVATWSWLTLPQRSDSTAAR
ncbi:MAG: caspase family protein [Planctomycetes bacterium]|nr:caspase family protein [Planctomycetota bacterium]